MGAAIGFAGRVQSSARVLQSIGPSSLANELVEDPEHDRPGAAEPGGPLPTDAPRVRANSLTTKNPGFRGFGGLDHFDSRTADGGNQFSLEPPDGAICAGAGRELEMVNNAIAVYDRSGKMVAGPVGVNEFFGYAPGIDRTTGVFGPFMGDIKCLFDPGTRRWFLSSFNLEQDPTTGDFTGHTSVDWAVSKTSNPAGGYTVFSIDTTNGDGTMPGHPGCPCLSDQPLIGVDAYGFYISTNEFSFFGPEFNNAQLYAISKTGLAKAANGGAVPQASWFDQIPLAEGYSYSLQPASAPVDSGFERENGGTAYFLSALDFNAAFDNRIAVWALTGTKSLGSNHPSPSLQSKVIKSQAYGQPPAAAQAPGSTPLRDALAAGLLGDAVENSLSPIASNDDRMGTATFADGLLWGSLATAVKFSKDGPVHVGAAWFAVRPSIHDGRLRASIVKQGYVSVKDEDVVFPGVAINASGQGRPGLHPDRCEPPPECGLRPDRPPRDECRPPGRRRGGSPGRLQRLPARAPTDPPPDPRWGDYTGTAVDETGKVWFEAEYIAQTCTLDEFVVDHDLRRDADDARQLGDVHRPGHAIGGSTSTRSEGPGSSTRPFGLYWPGDRPGLRARGALRDLQHGPLRAHPGLDRRSSAARRAGRDPRGVGRRLARRAARDRSRPARGFPGPGRLRRGLAGDRHRVRRRRAGAPGPPGMSRRRDPTDDDRRGGPFLRGLTIGVLVGAAIAGSRIWRRLLRRPGPA